MAGLAAPEGKKALLILTEILSATDPGIRDAVLIGSAVYAPESARDYDMVVTTTAPPEAREQLFEALAEALSKNSDKNVDLVLRRPGDEIRGLALGILAGRVLLGNGETIEEARAFYREAGGLMNSFEEAALCLEDADANFHSASKAAKPLRQLRYWKVAFGHLFDAARIAALCYLGREDTRWGGVEQRLPPPFGQQFKEMIQVFHILYTYDGKIPNGQEAEEYRKWKAQTERFVAQMKERTLDRDGDR